MFFCDHYLFASFLSSFSTVFGHIFAIGQTCQKFVYFTIKFFFQIFGITGQLNLACFLFHEFLFGFITLLPLPFSGLFFFASVFSCKSQLILNLTRFLVNQTGLSPRNTTWPHPTAYEARWFHLRPFVFHFCSFCSL